MQIRKSCRTKTLEQFISKSLVIKVIQFILTIRKCFKLFQTEITYTIYFLDVYHFSHFGMQSDTIYLALYEGLHTQPKAKLWGENTPSFKLLLRYFIKIISRIT